jgi:endonuclease G
MLWSEVAMDESFFFSNMSPHLATFHQAGGIWYKLEDLVKIWGEVYDTLYIVAGPVLKQGIRGSIGKNNVSVPEYFYKVILNYTSNRIEGIGFIMPHEKVKSGNPVRGYAVTIDSVQNFTGIDFFHKLPDAQKEYIKNRLCDTCWIWEKPKK